MRTTSPLPPSRRALVALAPALLAAACAGELPPGPDAPSRPSAAAAAQAAVWEVTTTADLGDPDIDTPQDDRQCDGSRSGDDDVCSLRAAIQNHNKHSPGGGTIRFALGTGTPTIAPTLPFFPEVRGTVVIDGGTGGATRVAILGQELRFLGANSSIRRLVLQSAGGLATGGIALHGTGGHSVMECYFGTDATGNAPHANVARGVTIAPTVGTSTGSDGNLVSRNVFGRVQFGVQISMSSRNIVSANNIGVGADGRTPLPVSQVAISVAGLYDATSADGNVIGGLTPGQGNVIASIQGVAAGDAVLISAGATGTRVEGNLIGVDRSGNRRPNHAFGIAVSNSDRVAIRGNTVANNGGGGISLLGELLDAVIADNVVRANTGAGIVVNAVTGLTLTGNTVRETGWTPEPRHSRGTGIELYRVAGATVTGNTIAENAGDGVLVADGEGVTVRTNSITRSLGITPSSEATGLAIDLAGSLGPAPNDVGDADEGSNGLQNFPVLTAAVSVDLTQHVIGTLPGRPNARFTVDLYGNAECDASGHGEGESHLGAVEVVTDAAGNGTFKASLPARGHVVTAPATDAEGNTSELSRCAPSTVAGSTQRSDIRPDVMSVTGTTVVSAALLSDGRFDATKIHPSMLRLAVITPAPGAPQRVRVIQRGGVYNVALRDADGDGDIDLIASFSMAELRAAGLTPTSGTLRLDVVLQLASDPSPNVPQVVITAPYDRPPTIVP